MGQRQLKLVNITEKDRITPKIAKPEQDMSYNSLIGITFVEQFPIQAGYNAVLIPEDSEDKNWSLRTSIVGDIELDFDQRGSDLLVVTTRNTVYYFEIIKKPAHDFYSY